MWSTLCKAYERGLQTPLALLPILCRRGLTIRRLQNGGITHHAPPPNLECFLSPDGSPGGFAASFPRAKPLRLARSFPHLSFSAAAGLPHANPRQAPKTLKLQSSTLEPQALFNSLFSSKP